MCCRSLLCAALAESRRGSRYLRTCDTTDWLRNVYSYVILGSFAGEEIEGDRVIIAPGHSARGMYRHLIDIGVKVEPKPFSVGFRVEHPQVLVDTAQYGTHIASQVQRGKGKVPVADYRLAANVESKEIEQVCMAKNLCIANDTQHRNPKMLGAAVVLGQGLRLVPPKPAVPRPAALEL